MTQKPTIIFFSRSYQSTFFPFLKSEKYNSIYVTLTNKEKKEIESKGYIVEYCFESYKGSINEISDNYLKTSFVSDRFLHRYNINDRIKFLKKEIAFWREVFEKFKPIAVLNEQVAIEISEVMYIEAKAKGIKYLAWMTNPINGYFYWISNPMSLSLPSCFLELYPSKTSFEIAKTYIEKTINTPEKPFYIQPFINQTKLKNLLSSIKWYVKTKFKKINGEFSFYEDYEESSINYLERSLNSFFVKYDKWEEINDYEKILYPLHYEPESALSYLSEFFSNQVALIKNLIKCLKNNQVLIVKEHPQQAGMLLTKKYQEIKNKNSQLFYFSSKVSSFDIIKKIDLVITLTSHLGWEALILGKPVYVLGRMFYDKYPYVNHFDSFEKLRDDIRSKNYIYPKQDATIEFIAKIIEHSYKGIPFPSPILYSKENIDNIVYAIEKELNLIK